MTYPLVSTEPLQKPWVVAADGLKHDQLRVETVFVMKVFGH